MVVTASSCSEALMMAFLFWSQGGKIRRVHNQYFQNLPSTSTQQAANDKHLDAFSLQLRSKLHTISHVLPTSLSSSCSQWIPHARSVVLFLFYLSMPHLILLLIRHGFNCGISYLFLYLFLFKGIQATTIVISQTSLMNEINRKSIP